MNNRSSETKPYCLKASLGRYDVLEELVPEHNFCHIFSEVESTSVKTYNYDDTENRRLTTKSTPRVGYLKANGIPPNDSKIPPRSFRRSSDVHECTRTCDSSKTPKNCHYRFVLENYMTMNS